MVSTSDFDSGDIGSIPIRRFLYLNILSFHTQFEAEIKGYCLFFWGWGGLFWDGGMNEWSVTDKGDRWRGMWGGLGLQRGEKR